MAGALVQTVLNYAAHNKIKEAVGALKRAFGQPETVAYLIEHFNVLFWKAVC